MNKSLYATLGVDPTAGDSAIRAAYDTQLAATAPDDKLRLMVLKEAINVLGHSQRRAVYDASLLEQAAKEAAKEAAQRTSSRPASETRTTSRRGTSSSAAAPGMAPTLKLMWVGGALVVAALGWMVMRSSKPKPVTKPLMSQTLAVEQANGQADTQTAPAHAQQMPSVQDTVAVSSAADNTPAGPALKPEALFAKLSPSIVRINVLDHAGNGIALGSGVVIERGTVITNCHVAKAGPRLKVKHQDSALDASLVVADELHDLCKLSVQGLDAPAVEQGRVSRVKVGQKVYALGAPQGLDLTLSDGMVSSLRKTDEGDVIQTSAPVSPGSSGGGLFNDQGQLVGIVTFQMRSGQNLNFAVPVDWIGTMSSTHLAEGEHFPEQAGIRSANGAPTPAMNPDVVGTWHCFGPLTGRGLDMTLDAQGRVSGQFDGRPLGGRYTLQNNYLTLTGDRFLVEELSATRMVLSLGEGRRLACNH